MRISVIIPVYNEEGTIGGLLNRLKDCGVDELLVADGGSVDRTVEIASRHARIVHAKTGRATRMNAAAECASGDVLLFLHADARLGKTALGVVRKVMADPTIVGGNFDIRYEGKDWAAAVFTHITQSRRRGSRRGAGNRASRLPADGREAVPGCGRGSGADSVTPGRRVGTDHRTVPRNEAGSGARAERWYQTPAGRVAAHPGIVSIHAARGGGDGSPLSP